MMNLYNVSAFFLQLFFLSFASAANDMTYVPLDPAQAAYGGYCMDGSPAGYYIRSGDDESLFVIKLKGGGACMTEEDCLARNGTTLGSSKKWEASMRGTDLLSGDCTENPSFCDATVVYVPYCTGDTHRGNNTEATSETWGLYIDGHANFAAVVDKLVSENGLGNADNVLLTGSSAGSIGALFNVDWLADRLPNTIVKAVPVAGWYFPGSLGGDLPEIHSPSDYPHFAAGENGNTLYDDVQGGVEIMDRFHTKDILPQACLDEYGVDKWWVCASAHNAYRFIKSQIFSVHTQYDKQQIFSANFAPMKPANDAEKDLVDQYVEMWGEATRTSLQQIKDGVSETTKPHADGVFSASCILHGTPTNVLIEKKNWMEIVHDWFFQEGLLEEYYQLIETCLESDRMLPCNEKESCRRIENKPKIPPKVKNCAQGLYNVGCLESFRPRDQCVMCAFENRPDLSAAKCNRKMVQIICAYGEENDLSALENEYTVN